MGQIPISLPFSRQIRPGMGLVKAQVAACPKTGIENINQNFNLLKFL